MGPFEPAEHTNSEQWPTDGADDQDLDVGLLTCGREAFAGFTNLAVMQRLPMRDGPVPWRRR
jgi:hypothetical protein